MLICMRMKRMRGRRRELFHVRQSRDQFAYATVFHPNRFHHRHAEATAQYRFVNRDATSFRHITHVQCDNHRDAQTLHRQHQTQTSAQIGRIQHADHIVRPFLATRFARQHIARHLLIGRARIQAVSAGQIENTQGLSGRRGKAPFFALYRDTGVVRYFLTAASQSIKNRGLAAIGIAHQGNQSTAGK